ncbi:MAG: TetR/AcrR family transcriptional regulator [Oscillospiraceae bacterium]|nr:TetR/AcrR family transcriptional regulator [Oscillospiraceae bacterium]
MSKKQALTEFHRGSILAAAERLFGEKGIDKTTMDDIAREAEYSKATLYVYFQSKEEIVCDIVLHAMIILRKRIADASDASEEWNTAYYLLCNTMRHFFAENPAVYGVVLDLLSGRIEKRPDGEDMSELLRVGREINQIVLRFFQRGVTEACIGDTLPAEELLLLFWVWLSGVIATAAKAGDVIAHQLKKDTLQFFREGTTMLLRAFSPDVSAGESTVYHT